MTLNKEQLISVCRRHKDFFVGLDDHPEWVADDVFSLLDFASDLLDAEAGAIESKEAIEPWEEKTAARFRRVAYELYELGDESYGVLLGEEEASV